MNNYLHHVIIAGAAVWSASAAAAPNCANAASDPDGDGWGWENNQSCVVVFKGFRVAGNVLKDANGTAFVARGVNNPHAWFDTQAYNVLPNLAARRRCRTWPTIGPAPTSLPSSRNTDARR